MIKLALSLLAQIAGIFDNYRPLLNQRAIDMQSRYAPEAFRQSRRYANAPRVAKGLSFRAYAIANCWKSRQ
ncbi:MAG: hypothetical protein F6K50_12360 [Moorea sp. SIO3I7]|uniref:hypothetical protein n=1 Tax=Moorena sp. SIO3I8 TaxID=2607833 RepID=UPI0013C15915|nr:hypothetical protein [Moorena sp. SIO3I8]NEN96299.1 hypothetical protein [Moorena sp. SIO3I7]NEO06026.1 hypothetical protein [Moorena sp. SIO3I8]